MIRRCNLALGVVLLAVLCLALVVDPAQRRSGAVIQLPSVDGGIDRCPTCHLFASDLPRPAKTHPKIPGHASLTRFGCTPCHGGQGRRLDRAAHLPRLGGGPDPFLGKPQRQARCARCHVPTDLSGAPALGRGFAEYLEAGCVGCHLPGRESEGIGPDLRRVGRRTRAELNEALLDPRAKHGAAVMWSLRFRYDDGTPAGRGRLDDLVTALLAMADSPQPYRRQWAKPTLQTDVRCEGCHRTTDRRKPVGPPHRCTLLRKRKDLACSRCHGSDRVDGTADGECPQIRAVRPLCPVCHLRDFFAGDTGPR